MNISIIYNDKTRRITKGIERKRFIKRLRIVYKILFGLMPSYFQTISRTPKIRPSTKEIEPEIMNILKVAIQLFINLYQYE